MSVESFRTKSRNALATARSSLAAGDFDAAVNRAYYAMFDLARAALAYEGALDFESSRKHKTVLSRLSEHFVRSGRLDRRFGGDINAAFEQRAIADYEGTMMRREHAEAAVRSAEESVAALGAAVGDFA